MNKKTLALLVVVLFAGIAVGFVSEASLGQAPSKPPKYADITLISEGHEGGMLGPDNKTHDTIMPSNFTVYVGEIVNLTIINYDEGPHTFTSPGLGVNFKFPGTKGNGVPPVSYFQFEATKPGVFFWYCNTPCDKGQGGWAMTSGPNGEQAQPGYMAGYVTVLNS